MSPRKQRVPGRPVARFSNLLEAIGTVAVLAWGIVTLFVGHPVLGTALIVVGLGIGFVTVREYMGHGLGRAPQADDAVVVALPDVPGPAVVVVDDDAAAAVSAEATVAAEGDAAQDSAGEAK